MPEDAGVQCVTWRQFQLGIGAVFIANCLVSVIIARTLTSGASATNTNIINDPRTELREQYAEKAWATVKEKSLNAN